MKNLPPKRKFAGYVIRHVTPETIVCCPRCKRVMKYIRCSPNTLLASLSRITRRPSKNTKMFDYVYKCNKCNLWQHHWAHEYRDSLKPRKK